MTKHSHKTRDNLILSDKYAPCGGCGCGRPHSPPGYLVLKQSDPEAWLPLLHYAVVHHYDELSGDIVDCVLAEIARDPVGDELADVFKPERDPDETIYAAGEPYLLRWHLIPRQAGAGNIYLHVFLLSDQDRDLHDHPWDSRSVILSGSYREHTSNSATTFGAGNVIKRSAEDAHRIEVLEGPVITLFVTGVKLREWGFHTPRGWVGWRKYHGLPEQP